MFELEVMTKARFNNVEILSEKDREPDASPGAKISVQTELPNSALSYFDGTLRSFLFHKSAASSERPKDKQKGIEGVEPVSDLPNLTAAGSKLKTLSWHEELTGYTLTIDRGIGGKSNIELDACKLTNFHFSPKEGGTTVVRFVVESGDVKEAHWGKLPALKRHEVSIKLTAPEVVQADVEE